MKNQNCNKEVQRFSIRKYSFGVASVLLGCFLFGITNVSADENSTATISTTTEIMSSHYGKTMTSNSENSTNNNSVVDRNNSDTTSVIDNTQSKNEEKAGTIQTKPVENVSISKNEVLSSTSTPNDSVESKNNSTTSMSSTKVKETDDSNKDISSSTTSSIQKKDIRISKDDSLVDENSGEIKEMVTKPTFTPKIVRHALAINNGSVARGDDYPWKHDSVDPNNRHIDKWRLYTRECTSFTAYRLSSVNHFELPGAYGNGGQWGRRARREGYRVDMNPAKGSVAWLDDGSYGHVTWVSNVIGNNVEIEEYNYGYTHNYHIRTVSKTAFSGYIHFKDLAGGSTPSEPTKPNTGGTLPSSGTYHFTDRKGIKAEPKISSPDLAYYDNGYSVTYDKTLIADNYEWISYVSYSGNRRYIAINKIATPTTPVVKGTINIQNKNDQAGTFDVVITNVSSNSGLKEVQVPTWSTQNGQDDIIWYRATKQNDGTYKVSVNIHDHKNNRGEYNIHLYYVIDNGKQIGVGGTKTTIAEVQTPAVTLTGTINIQNKNNQTGTFDVVISNVASPNGVKEVKVPIWASQNGQDDIIWYRATKQNDGTYKVSVRASDHKNYQGEYNIHLYYVQNDGKLVGVTGTKTDVHFITKPAIPDRGVYTFTGRFSIKAEPKISSPELAYYEAGNTVNYDKVLFADGHYWISYLSFSGNRRYISIA
ncbi:GBS Bsp-like repeat-containing protein [Streptococcus anginosus]|uniref:GBS Bsp-like repeat-containing protein n=1 Tax=Streptococcus anginosus TaxID=1328 RepID=UPI0003908577|nr:GBS Bsp-like repeat-containing protein [Streptococcus anginosus]AGU84218.1 putative cell wall associated protein [Streptococcus anginosus C238]MDP1385636.1 GBS Bsp-like repeat-containing protein [Streptococcus anginosus]